LWGALNAVLRCIVPAHLFTGRRQILPQDVLVIEILGAARALIELEDKWIQGRYQTFGGRRCAMGALRTAGRLLGDPRAFEASKKLLAGEAISRGYSHVEMMNDRSTHAQVLSAFDGAIAKARVQAGE
jgi:hypothetical protein